MKKRVILYGVRGMRENIEYLLDDRYEIIGYSDADEAYSMLTEYEYRPFYTPEKLDDISTDYIIITIINQDVSRDAVKKLISYGIPQNRLIETCKVIPLKSPFEIPLDSFGLLNNEKAFEGLILGMSYAYYGILSYCFTKRFYKLAHFSADIFFHNKNLEYISEWTDCLKNDVKYVVFEMPYYAFNWDVSKAENIIRCRMALYEKFNDYHNYGKDELEEWYIQEYKILKDMFGNKKAFNASAFSNNYEHRILSGITENEHPFYKAEHIWTKIRPNTIVENYEIFRKSLELLYSLNSNMKVLIVVPPFYMELLQDQMKDIQIMKDIFYQNINKIKKDYPIQVLDFIDKIHDKECFFDIHHLNAIGAYKFSTILNEEFKKNLY